MKRGKFRLALAALSGLLGCAIAGITYWSNTAMATPGFQFNSETLSRSVFEDIDVKSNVPYTHQVKIKTKGTSDVYVVRNRVPPGGYSGWHTHPGPSVVSIRSGVATVYSGDDPSCAPVTYAAGTGFIDEGGGHVHMVRNEGSVELETIAFQVVPAGADRRIDAPDPGFCPF